jgi:hypothetical protein
VFDARFGYFLPVSVADIFLDMFGLTRFGIEHFMHQLFFLTAFAKLLLSVQVNTILHFGQFR